MYASFAHSKPTESCTSIDRSLSLSLTTLAASSPQNLPWAVQVMQYADQALMEGLKGRCAMLLHPHVTRESALPLLQQALAMDSDK